jgi:hypothetical protein
MPTTRMTPGSKHPPATGPIAAPASPDRAERARITRAVTAYLDLVAGVARPVRNPRTAESELARIGRTLAGPRLPSTVRLRLLQDRRDIKAHGLPGPTREEVLREAFIAHAASYARIHGISYQAFIAFGVPAEDLNRAGLRPALRLVQGS